METKREDVSARFQHAISDELHTLVEQGEGLLELCGASVCFLKLLASKVRTGNLLCRRGIMSVRVLGQHSSCPGLHTLGL